MLSLFNIDAPGGKSGLALLSSIRCVPVLRKARIVHCKCMVFQRSLYHAYSLTTSIFYPLAHLALQPDTVSVEVQVTDFTDKAEY